MRCVCVFEFVCVVGFSLCEIRRIFFLCVCVVFAADECDHVDDHVDRDFDAKAEKRGLLLLFLFFFFF